MKHILRKELKICLLLIIFSNNMSCFGRFPKAWELMQQDYARVNNNCPQNQSTLNKFFHRNWLDAQKKIKDIIKGKPQPEFVKLSPLDGCMLRGGYDNFQKYEKQFLMECLSSKTRAFIAKAKETDFLNLTREVPQLNISSSTLGHLFYIAKVLEGVDAENINTIVEFGGGYGNLARLFKQIMPESTILMIDLPEMIALQALFLRQTLSGVTILVHDSIPNEFIKGAIHLLPVYFINDLNFNANLFISTFALSETTDYVQNTIIKKNFFNSKYCYITGQMHGWGNSFNFVHHSKVLSGVRENFDKVWCQPYHHGLVSNQESYEILGKRDE